MFYERKKIYDLVLRLCHAVIALSCLVLLFTAWCTGFLYEEGLYRKVFWVVHIFAGYALTLGLTVRLVWGVVGSYHARWSRLFQFKQWRTMIQTRKNSVIWSWGHHPQASLAYIIFYSMAVFLVITGFFLAAVEHHQGFFVEQLFDDMSYQPWMSNIHEILSWSVFIFIISHVTALFYHEKNDNLPIVQSMFSGYQYKKKMGVQNENKN